MLTIRTGRDACRDACPRLACELGYNDQPTNERTTSTNTNNPNTTNNTQTFVSETEDSRRLSTKRFRKHLGLIEPKARAQAVATIPMWQNRTIPKGQMAIPWESPRLDALYSTKDERPSSQRIVARGWPRRAVGPKSWNLFAYFANWEGLIEWATRRRPWRRLQP